MGVIDPIQEGFTHIEPIPTSNGGADARLEIQDTHASVRLCGQTIFELPRPIAVLWMQDLRERREAAWRKKYGIPE